MESLYRFAVVPVAGGIVTNIVVGNDLETVTSVVGECVQETDETGPAHIGDTWDTHTFITPPIPEPPPVEE